MVDLSKDPKPAAKAKSLLFSLNTVIFVGFPLVVTVLFLLFTPGSPVMAVWGPLIDAIFGNLAVIFSFIGMFALRQTFNYNGKLSSTGAMDLLCALGTAVTLYLALAYASPVGVEDSPVRTLAAWLTFFFALAWIIACLGNNWEFSFVVTCALSVILLALLVGAAWIDRPAFLKAEMAQTVEAPAAAPAPVIEPRDVIQAMATEVPEVKAQPIVSPEALAALDYNGTDPMEVENAKALVYAEIAKDENTRRSVNRKWLYTDALAAPDLMSDPDTVVIAVPTDDYKVVCNRSAKGLTAYLTSTGPTSALTQGIIDRLCRIRFAAAG